MRTKLSCARIAGLNVLHSPSTKALFRYGLLPSLFSTHMYQAQLLSKHLVDQSLR